MYLIKMEALVVPLNFLIAFGPPPPPRWTGQTGYKLSVQRLVFLNDITGNINSQQWRRNSPGIFIVTKIIRKRMDVPL